MRLRLYIHNRSICSWLIDRSRRISSWLVEELLFFLFFILARIFLLLSYEFLVIVVVVEFMVRGGWIGRRVMIPVKGRVRLLVMVINGFLLGRSLLLFLECPWWLSFIFRVGHHYVYFLIKYPCLNGWVLLVLIIPALQYRSKSPQWVPHKFFVRHRVFPLAGRSSVSRWYLHSTHQMQLADIYII